MKFVTPANYIIDSTNVANEYPDHVTNQQYEVDDRVVFNNEVYQCIVQTTSAPDVGSVSVPPSWVKIGYSNQYRMFTEGVDTVSSATGSIDVTLTIPTLVDNFTVLGLVGSSVQLIITDSVEGVVYDKTFTLTDIGVADWYQWHFYPYDTITTGVFDGIPPYPGATYQLIVSGATPTDIVKAGRVIVGTEFDLGGMTYSTTFGALTTSKVTRNDFGESQFLKRRTLARNDYDVVIDARRLSDIIAALKQIDAVPTLFIGDDGEDASIVFGFTKEYSVNARSPMVAYLTLQVEEF